MGAPANATDDRRAARRGALTAAGLELFGTRGYAATTVEAVCAQAGLRRVDFDEHFADKHELFRAVHDAVIAEVTGNVVEALELEPKGVERRARAGLSAFARTLADDPRKARVQLVEAIGASPELEARRREVRRRFAAVIARDAERAATAGQIPRRDFGVVSLALVGAVFELFSDWAASEEPGPVDPLVEECVRLFVAATTAP